MILEKDDIFEIRIGDKIYVNIPRRFIFENDLTSWETSKVDICVGEIRGGFDTSIYCGYYVCVKTAFEGGSPEDFRDPYPNGHHVFAKKIINSVISEECIDFYQTGCFTAMIMNVAKISPVDAIQLDTSSKPITEKRPKSFLLGAGPIKL